MPSAYYFANADQIPTARAPVDDTELDFRAPRPIGETRMDTAFGCHPREGLEQKLESGPVVDRLLGCGACSCLEFGELSVAPTPVHL